MRESDIFLISGDDSIGKHVSPTDKPGTHKSKGDIFLSL